MDSVGSAARLAAGIRHRRIALGMSQTDLTLATGISRAKISAMENGRFGSARLLLEVCEALGLELVPVPREDVGRVSHLIDLPDRAAPPRRVSRKQRDRRG